jgi:hypothetical protein
MVHDTVSGTLPGSNTNCILLEARHVRIRRILWNPKVHYRIHKSLPRVPCPIYWDWSIQSMFRLHFMKIDFTTNLLPTAILKCCSIVEYSNKDAWFRVSYFCHSGVSCTSDQCFHHGSDWANCAKLLWKILHRGPLTSLRDVESLHCLLFPIILPTTKNKNISFSTFSYYRSI